MNGKKSHIRETPQELPENPDGLWLSLLLRQVVSLERRGLRAESEEMYVRALEAAGQLRDILLETIEASPRGCVPYARESVRHELRAAAQLRQIAGKRKDEKAFSVALELRIAALRGSGELDFGARQILTGSSRSRRNAEPASSRTSPSFSPLPQTGSP